MDGSTIRAAIVDSCPIFSHGLAEILASGGFTVVGCWLPAGGSLPAGALAPESVAWRADVLLLDPAVLGEAELPHLAAAPTPVPVLLLGSVDHPWQLAPYLDAGAAGFVDRRTDVDGLLAAVRAVAAGNCWQAGRSGRDQLPAGPDRPALSPREVQVLRQVARGLTHGQVARRLGISPHTVDTYIKRIRSKLDLGNKADLTRAAILGSFAAAPPGSPAPVAGSGDVSGSTQVTRMSG